MPEETNNNTNNEGKTEDMYSPYDWEAFGFKIYDEDRDSHILTESPLIRPILKYVDENGDGKMSVEEFSRHKGNKNIRDLLSKMICVHRSEWAYSGDAFANLKKEVEKYYDEEIKRLNPDNENARAECESKRNEDLKLFEEKVKNLTFLDQIKFDNKSSLPDGYFYFFHPVAFVEQMQKMRSFYKIGDKGNVVKEINFRLAGFGGVLPGDAFTENTEKGVKQFQKDYMNMEIPTGIVDNDTLYAIDDFSDKYRENIDNYRCPCGECDGFGKGRYKGQYRNKTSNRQEMFHNYEYPGMHQSLLWGVSALKFYLSIKLNKRYTVKCISSGYRCWTDNENKNPKRKTTNHMGKAVDLHFNKKGIRSKLPADMEELREKIFCECIGAPKQEEKNGKCNFGWVRNRFGLESLKEGASTWVHLDVREFDRDTYLKDEYFIKSAQERNFGSKLSNIKN